MVLEQQLMLRAEDDEEWKVAEVAIAFSLSHKAISAREKAATILRYDKKTKSYVPVNVPDEFRHIKEDIGTLATAIPDYGEDPVTAAVAAILNLALLYHINLDEITEVELASESLPKSKNAALLVMYGVNKASSVILEETGIRIGRLKGLKYREEEGALKRTEGMVEETEVIEDGIASSHLQDACVSGMAGTKRTAKTGLPPHSKKIEVETDYSSYQSRRKEGETGDALGAVAKLIVPLKEAKGKGFKISSRLQSEASWDSTEFMKEMVGRLGGTGLAVSNEDPIVYGQHSNYSYLYLTYRVIKNVLKKDGLDINSIINVPVDLALFMHGPWKGIHDHTIAYAVRLSAHHNEAFNEILQNEIGHVEEPMLPGFKSLEKEFKFLHKLTEVYLRFAERVDGIARLRMFEDSQYAAFANNIEEKVGKDAADTVRLFEKYYPRLSDKLTGELNSKVRLRAEKMAAELASIAKHNNVTDERIAGPIRRTIDTLKTIAESSGKIEDIRSAFAELNDYISKHERSDQDYNKLIMERSTAFKVLKDRFQIEAADTLLRLVGNLDSASADLNQIGLIAFGKNLKRALGTGYGSGSHSVGFMMEAMEYEYMREALLRNIAHELQKRKYVYHDWFIQRKLTDSMPNTELPVYRLDNSIEFNPKALAKLARYMYAPEISKQVEARPTRLRTAA